LNQAVPIKQLLQFSVASSNPARCLPNFAMVVAKWLLAPFSQIISQLMNSITPLFVARRFGLGQLPPRLFFTNTLKPREGISEIMEASRVFQLGSGLPSLCLH